MGSKEIQAEQKKELCLIRYPVDRLHVVLEARKLRVALAADVTEVRPAEGPRGGHGGREVDVEAIVHQASEKIK